MDVWRESDEVIALAELDLEPVPAPLPAWQRDLLGRLFPAPVSVGPDATS